MRVLSTPLALCLLLLLGACVPDSGGTPVSILARVLGSDASAGIEVSIVPAAP